MSYVKSSYRTQTRTAQAGFLLLYKSSAGDPQASPVLSQPRLVCVLLGLRESIRNGLCCDSGAAGLEGKVWVKGNKSIG